MTDDAHPVIEITRLKKSFGPARGVDGLSLAVNRGEIYGFLGPNGAGKTTTIRLLLGILRPDSGSAALLGPASPTVAVRRRVGYLASDMALDEDLTGRQYLDYVSGMYGKDCTGKAEDLAKRLEAKLDIKIGNYSRGNRQKLLLIAALMHDPELLVMDEPTSGFDPLVQETFVQLIREYRDSGGTVFMSSHILSEVQQLCDKVGFIRDGRLVGESTVAGLGVGAQKLVRVTGWAKSHGTLAGLRELRRADNSVELSYKGDVKDLLAYFSRQNLQDITIQPPDLEEMFIDYYQAEGGKKV